MKINQHVSMIETRKLYQLEYLFPPEKDRSMTELSALGKRIWQSESRNMKMLPSIVAGQGSFYGNKWLSFCFKLPGEAPKIVLSRGQRKHSVLIHEVTHALGYWDHSTSFIKKYFELLVKYDGWNYDFLLLTAYSVNINLEKLK